MFNRQVIFQWPELFEVSWGLYYTFWSTLNCCCIRSCRVGSSMDACCMVSTWTWFKSGVILWIVTSNPLISVLPLGLTLLNASAKGNWDLWAYFLVTSYGCNFSSSLCRGASLGYFRCISSKGLWSHWHTNFLPDKQWWNLIHPHTTGTISISILAYLVYGITV